MLYGELGIYPLDIHIKSRIIGYWLRLVKSHNEKIDKLLYDVMLMFTKNGEYMSSWIAYVHTLLLTNGFGFVWYLDFEHTDENMKRIKTNFKNRIKLQYIQDWQSSVNASSKCVLYKDIKEDFIIENYLRVLPWKFCKYILRLRLCNHKLNIETGRYCNIERSQRTCEHCTLNLLGDEYHLFFVCNNPEIVQLRIKFIPNYYSF